MNLQRFLESNIRTNSLENLCENAYNPTETEFGVWKMMNEGEFKHISLLLKAVDHFVAGNENVTRAIPYLVKAENEIYIYNDAGSDVVKLVGVNEGQILWFDMLKLYPDLPKQ